MPDIRLVRPRGRHLGAWAAGFAVLGLLMWASAFVFGDRTEERQRIGAEIGMERAPILAAEPTPFQSMVPLQPRDLGRLTRLTGVAESGVRRNAVWVRAAGGRRILVRFEPAPDTTEANAAVRGAIASIRPGSAVSLDGYLQKISAAEFRAVIDTLGVALPRPKPGRKFGDRPDSNFLRIDSLFIKNYYVSVRPQTLVSGMDSAALAAAARRAPALPAAPVAPPAAAPTTAPAASADTAGAAVTTPTPAAPEGAARSPAATPPATAPDTPAASPPGAADDDPPGPR